MSPLKKINVVCWASREKKSRVQTQQKIFLEERSFYTHLTRGLPKYFFFSPGAIQLCGAADDDNFDDDEMQSMDALSGESALQKGSQKMHFSWKLTKYLCVCVSKPHIFPIRTAYVYYLGRKFFYGVSPICFCYWRHEEKFERKVIIAFLVGTPNDNIFFFWSRRGQVFGTLLVCLFCAYQMWRWWCGGCGRWGKNFMMTFTFSDLEKKSFSR